MPKVKVNGITLHYEESGSGDPLLLIMGVGGIIRRGRFRCRRLPSGTV